MKDTGYYGTESSDREEDETEELDTLVWHDGALWGVKVA